MDPEQQKAFQELLELTRENNKILTKMYRSMMWGRVVRVLYWILVIGIAIGSFYFIQPYMDQLKEVYGNVSDAKTQFNTLFNF